MANKPLYRMSRCGLFAAIICVCAFINIPFGSVPISAALMGVMLAGVVLSPLEAFCCTSVYIFIGTIGIPVFSAGGAGVSALIGPTGGYIWSYPLLALIVALFRLIPAKSRWKEYVISIIGCILGTAVCYICGTMQYMLVCQTPFFTAVVACIVPFIPFDIVKSLIACTVGITLKKRI